MASTLDILNTARIAFYDSRPAAYIYQSTAQNFVNNTDAAVIFDTVDNDNWGGWSAGSATRYTAQVPGVYQISGNVVWAGNATNRRLGYLRFNGAIINGSGSDVPANGTFACSSPTVTVTKFLNAGDYVEVWGNQNSGGNLLTNAGPGVNTCSLAIAFLHF